ncbi:MAG: prolyl oligopeptidase family serine peptidase [Planctomycetes bacterium]|nr:prolyl oligopeptidase family serine peptidase [Planctomycetota bacterium]
MARWSSCGFVFASLLFFATAHGAFGLKPPLTISAEQAAAVSPLLHVGADTPPICLIHGDHDELVPVEHSRSLYTRLQEAGRPSRLLVVDGAGHSFTEKDYAIAVPAMVEWFEKYLSPKSSP